MKPTMQLMRESKEMRAKFSQLEDDLLSLIDCREELTQSDLQGAAAALIAKAVEMGRWLDVPRVLTEEEETQCGERIAEVLALRALRGGRYCTEWGDKTALGIYRTMRRVIDDTASGA